MTEFELKFLVYLAVISLVSILLVIVDKVKAKKRRFRVPEGMLFLLAILGGSAAMYISMCLIRHKTQKNSFVFGIPLIFALQCAAVYYLYKYKC